MQNYKGARGGVGPNKESQNVTGTVIIAEQIHMSRRSNNKKKKQKFIHRNYHYRG